MKYFFIGSNSKFINIDKFDNINNLPIVYGKFTPEQFINLKKLLINQI